MTRHIVASTLAALLTGGITISAWIYAGNDHTAPALIAGVVLSTILAAMVGGAVLLHRL